MPTSTAFSNDMTAMPVVFSNDMTDTAHANSLHNMTWLTLPMPKHLNCLCPGKLFMKSWPTQHNLAVMPLMTWLPLPLMTWLPLPLTTSTAFVQAHCWWKHSWHNTWHGQQFFLITSKAYSFFWSPQQPESRQTVTDSITDATHDMNGTASDMAGTATNHLHSFHSATLMMKAQLTQHMTWMALPMMTLQVLPMTTPRACVRENTWPLERDSRCHWGTARGRCSLPDFGHTLQWCSLRCWLQANKAPHLMPSYWG